MKLNHLIIGASNAEESADFYCQILGYSREGKFLDTGTGQEGIVLNKPSCPGLLIVPFRKERLPNPQHLAFEVDDSTFALVIEHCNDLKIKMRSEPALESNPGGPTAHEEGGIKFSHFYFCDPSLLNIEIMKRL